MKSLIIYSSITGNTKSVAEAILEVLPQGTVIAPVQNAPDPGAYDFIALGFWVNKAQPDALLQKYLEQVKDKTIAFFGTLAAYPDSEHAQKTIENAQALGCANHVLGCFLCQGRLAQKRFEACMSENYQSTKHPMTSERKNRLLEASKHPNPEDFQNAQKCFAQYYQEAFAKHTNRS